MDFHTLFECMALQDIEDYVSNQQEENLHLDFKTVPSTDLKSKDFKRLFAVCLSGFSNSSGGLIIWGVDARKSDVGNDCAIGTKEISPLRTFVSRLNILTGEATSPILPGVKHRMIKTSEDSGFAVTIVPESDAGPHMAKLGENRYYKRSGDSFYMMEHFDLEDMFGRRRRPHLKVRIEAVGKSYDNLAATKQLSLLIRIENQGRGSARAPFVSVEAKPGIYVDRYGVDGNGKFGLTPLACDPHTRGEFQFGGDLNVVIHPATVRDVAKMAVNYSETVEDLTLRGTIAADDIKSSSYELIVRKEDIESALR